MRVLPFVAILLLTVPGFCETALFPLTCADPQEAASLLTGTSAAPVTETTGGTVAEKPRTAAGLMPPGLDKVWVLPEYRALVAQGTPEAITRAHELVALLDQPVRQVEVKVEPFWWEQADAAAPDPAAGTQEAPERADAQALLAAGGKRLRTDTWAPLVVANNRSGVFWLGQDFGVRYHPEALNYAVSVSPRVNADETVTLYLTLRPALADAEKGAVLGRADWEAQLTVKSGESLCVDYRQPGTGNKGRARILITPRALPRG
ncbi:hypothetical protein LLH03_14750 [bacterium]|nr:hypothetical protein [bacterium]